MNKKLKSIVKRLLVVMLASTVFTGCSNTGSTKNSSEGESGGSFTYGIQTEPDSLDPYKAAAADSKKILYNIFEGLVGVDTEGNIVPKVAEEYKVSDDAKTYSFKLRDGIKFHNGQAVTSEDVKYSIEQVINQKLEGFSNIDKVEVKDDKNIEIILKESSPEFLSYLTVAIIPKDYTEESTKPIGTGAFKFESYDPQQSLVLVKNDDYWQENMPSLDKVTFKFEADTNALLLDLQAGSIDAASITNDMAKQLNINKYDLVSQSSNAVQQLNLNNNYEPLKNVKVRQAISYAVDSSDINKTVNYGEGTVVGTPVVPGFKKYFNDTLNSVYDKDIDKAKSLLKEAGYENGFDLEITVPSNYTVHVDTAQIIVNELKEIGINASIRQVDWATWLTQVHKNREYQATVISTTANNLNINSFLGRYVSSSSKNYVNYNSAEYDKVYNEAVTALDEDKRIELALELQKMLSDDAASVYIQDINDVTAINKKFTGLTYYPIYAFDAAAIHKN